MAEKNVLALFLGLLRVLLEINKVLDVDQLAEGVLLDLFLSLVRGARLW